MDAKNFEYLSKKVGRFEQLQIMKERLNNIQSKLVKDEPLEIKVGNFNPYSDSSIQFGDSNAGKQNNNLVKDEYEELMREIKDNLIDAIGMKIIEIEYKMKEL